MDRLIYRITNRQIYVIYVYLGRYKEKYMLTLLLDRQIERQIKGQIDRQKDKCPDRQIQKMHFSTAK